jgi:hypothetical protein
MHFINGFKYCKINILYRIRGSPNGTYVEFCLIVYNEAQSIERGTCRLYFQCPSIGHVRRQLQADSKWRNPLFETQVLARYLASKVLKWVALQKINSSQTLCSRIIFNKTFELKLQDFFFKFHIQQVYAFSLGWKGQSLHGCLICFIPISFNLELRAIPLRLLFFRICSYTHTSAHHPRKSVKTSQFSSFSALANLEARLSLLSPQASCKEYLTKWLSLQC